MGTVIVWVLAIATILGGIAAIGYFRDKWRDKKKWTDEAKEINNTWWETSELKKRYEAQGCTGFSWSNKDRVAERISEGKQVVYETDSEKRIKYKLVNKTGQVLMCRKRD